jgi:hypothetical protein
MAIIRQVRDGLRLAPSIPFGRLLKSRGRQRRAKDILRGYHLFLCWDALLDSGLTARLVEGPVDLAESAAGTKLDPDSLRAVCRYLAGLNYLHLKGDSVRLARRGRELLQEPRGFLDLFSGYRPVMEHLPQLIRSGAKRAKFYRDEDKTRKGSTALGFELAFPLISRVIRQRGLRSVLDLGSSNLALLKYLCDRNGITGWGVDSDRKVVASSRTSLRGTAYEGRIKVLQGDALRPETIRLPGQDVEAVTAVDLLHLHLKDREPGVVKALSKLRMEFPKSVFILGEVCLGPDRRTAHSPAPKPEFNLCHRLTGQALPGADDWQDLFVRAGWRPAEKHVFPTLEHGLFIFRNSE